MEVYLSEVGDTFRGLWTVVVCTYSVCCHLYYQSLYVLISGSYIYSWAYLSGYEHDARYGACSGTLSGTRTRGKYTEASTDPVQAPTLSS